jgi:glycosyltransferase involved in cell wall biosynthesis
LNAEGAKEEREVRGAAGVQVSVVIAALNEAESIGGVVAAMPWSGGEGFTLAECIVVDNGSTDGTGAIAAAAGARVIVSERGYGAAMYAGSQAALASSTVLVFADGDGADDVARLGYLVGPIVRGEADFVLASRILGTREPGSMLPSQVMAGHVVGWLTRLFYGFRYTDMCAFRVIRRDALERMQMRERTYGWNLEMQLKAITMGLRICEVPVDYRCRAGGVSKVSGSLKASWQTLVRIVEVFVRTRKAGSREQGTGIRD